MKNFSLAIVVAILFNIKVDAQYQNQPLVTETHEQSETHIEVNQLNAAHRIGGWNDFRNGVKDVGFAITTNDGASWTIDLLENRTGWPGTPSVDQSYDPVVTFNRSGIPYYCYILERPGLLGALMVAKTTNNGTSWTHAQVKQNSIWDDKPWIAINNYPSMSERIYVVWAEILEDVTTRTYRILSAYSTDGGANFTMSASNPLDEVIAPIGPIPPPAITAKPLSNFPWTQIEAHVLGAVCAVAPNGDVYAAWMLANADGSGAIKVRKSTNGGSTFGAVILNRSMTVTFPFSIGRIDIRNFPTLAIDSNTGKIFIAYTHKETSGDLNTYYTYSTNGGTSWSASAIATETTTGHQFFPSLSVDPTGRVTLSYYDYRNQPNIDIYLAESLNNGTSFITPNIKVTSGYTTNNPTNSSYLHHYMGLTSTLGMSYPLWTDYRNANADIFYANVNRAPTSNTANATTGNGQRKLARDSNGTYHLIFETNQEVWYARKTTTDAEWNNYQRLNGGVGGGNAYPCITASGNTLYVVWQRKNGSTHDVYFATSQNGGTTWSNYVLASTSLAADPLPVIQAGVTTNFSLMTIYRTNSGGTTRLVARRTTSVNPALANWSTETTVPSTGANDFSPTMASTPNYWGQDGNFGVAYATTSGTIQYRYYQHATGGWSSTQFNLSSIVPGSNLTHKEPSLANAGAGFYDVHVAWHRVIGSGSSNYDHAIIYRKSNGFDNWPNAYTQLYYEQQQFPSITALPSGQVNVLFQLTSVDQIYKQNYNGFYWGSPAFVSSGRYPSVSTGSASAKYVWTSAGATTPYSISLSSEALSKTNSNSLPYYSRSIAWLENSGAYLEVIVHQFGAKLTDGTEQKFEFTPTYEDSIPITPANSWDWLAAAPTLLPTDAESLIVDYTVIASALEKVASGSGGNRYVNLDLVNAGGQKLASLTGLQLPASGSIAKTTRRLALALNGRGIPLSTVSLQANVNVKGMASKSGTFASLGHIYDFTKQGSQDLSRQANPSKGLVPKTAVLFENYPDPFNPETTIKYQIPEASRVTLKIYNVVGQEVRALVDQFQNAGTHEIHWDGKDGSGHNVPSGIYLYRLQVGEFFEVKKMTLLR